MSKLPEFTVRERRLGKKRPLKKDMEERDKYLYDNWETIDVIEEGWKFRLTSARIYQIIHEQEAIWHKGKI